MTSRITPYSEGGSIEERIDEIVQTGVDVHFEMLGKNAAMLRVGRYDFRVLADKGKLVCFLYDEDDVNGPIDGSLVSSDRPRQ